MSTSLDLAADVYLAVGVDLTAGVLTRQATATAGTVILRAPIIGPGGSGTIHVTGSFNAPDTGLFSALSPDATGRDTSFFYTLRDITGVSGPSVAQTFDFPFGTGVQQYDDAIAAGELYIALNLGPFWDSVSAISYDYTEPGASYAAPRRARQAPLRQHPRSDGLGTSSAPRLYPLPQSYQASNRRAGGYL